MGSSSLRCYCPLWGFILLLGTATASVTTINESVSLVVHPTTIGTGSPTTLPSRHRRHYRRVADSTVAVLRGGKKEISVPIPAAVAAGVVLAWNSGYLNGCCLAGILHPKQQGVAAVTGAYTLTALALCTGNWPQFRLQLGVIVSYLGGSMIAGLLHPYPVPFKLVATKGSSTTGRTFLIGAGLLYLASRAAALKTSSSSSHSMAVFYLVAAANGLQNSVTSVHTGNLIRSAHFSGITSDTGTYLGQALRGNRQNLYRLWINTALAVAFWTGGVVSYAATKHFASASLLLSAGLYAAIGLALMLLQL